MNLDFQRKDDNPFAIARPQASDVMMQRQTSFKGFGKIIFSKFLLGSYTPIYTVLPNMGQLCFSNP